MLLIILALLWIVLLTPMVVRRFRDALAAVFVTDGSSLPMYVEPELRAVTRVCTLTAP